MMSRPSASLLSRVESKLSADNCACFGQQLVRQRGQAMCRTCGQRAADLELDAAIRLLEQPNGPALRGGYAQSFEDEVETGTDLGRKVNR